MKRKIAVILLSLILLFGFVVVRDTVIDFIPNVKGTTLYVNESGTGGAYPSIQDAVNAAKPGDTVYVFSGTYNENVIVNRTINLTGEDKDTTIIVGWGIMDVLWVNVSWVNITGFTITNSDIPPSAGIALYNVKNCRIFNNNISSNRGNGIYIWSSSSNIITDNEITFNDWGGIRLDSSVNNTITNNEFINDGFFISGDQLSHYNSHTIPDSNIINGKSLKYFKNCDNFVIKGKSIGQLILANCSNVEVRDLQINKTDMGIEVAYCKYITLANNNISDTRYGIHLYSSSYTTISGNKVSNGTIGINLRYSANGEIIDNHVDYYFNYGINLEYSDNATIIGNTALNNGFGMRLYPSHNTTIRNNNVTWNDGYGILIISSGSTDIVVDNNIVANNSGSGIYLSSSSSAEVTNNDVIGNSYGIFIAAYTDVVVCGNNVSLNQKDGIRLINANNILVYHNNIINNKESQAIDNNGNVNSWDNGYPLGGNYWSDFDEASEGAYDDYREVNQNVAGSDGIVDKGSGASGGKNPYVIDGDSQDNYPLIRPFEHFIFLYECWNLISIPFIQSDTGLGKVLSHISGYYDTVWWYNTSDNQDHWKVNNTSKPSYLNDLDSLNHKMGFWIHITKLGGVLCEYPGTQPTENQTIQLYPGWNMVGYPSLTPHNRTEGLNNISFGSEVEAIWTFNADTQTWEEITESSYFEPGRGYWIYSNVKKTWDVPL